MLFFENDYFFMHGLESGIKLYDAKNIGINIFIRDRYINLPKNVQNEVQADSNDLGLQLQYKLTKKQNINFEYMNDLEGREFGNFHYAYHNKSNSHEYKIYANFQLNSSKYNSYYYGLSQQHIKADIATTLGLSAKYHLLSNIYLLGRIQGTLLGNEVRKSSIIDANAEYELYSGFGVFNNTGKKSTKKLRISPYIRFAHGWATPSGINEIFTCKTSKDPYNNQMNSLFFGYPLSDEVLNLPISMYITPGFVYHNSSDVQNSTQEYILAIKAYYTIMLPIRTRLGVAEGFSYAKEITYVESQEMIEKSYKPSNLMNYMDFSLDMHLGDIFGKMLNKWWIGYSIHHRSAIFEKSSMFGRISGGLNIQTGYIQWHF